MRGNMNSGTKKYTFFWFVENYSYCWHKNGQRLCSPSFTAEGLEGTVWNLVLFPRGFRHEDQGHITLSLNRSTSDGGPENFSIMQALSVLASDGTPLHSFHFDITHRKGHGYGIYQFIERDEVLLRRKVDYLPQDILTVRCEIWRGEGSAIIDIGRCSARTRIKVEKNYFLHEVGNFSTLQPNVKHTIVIPSHSQEGDYISSSLYFVTIGSAVYSCLCCEQKIMLEIVPSDTKQILLKCELYLLDKSGNEVKCGKADKRNDAEGKNILTFPLSLAREVVLSRKNEYLPDDKLSLICECTFSSGLAFQTIEETQHGLPRPVVKPTDYQKRRSVDVTPSGKTSAYPSVSQAIKALFESQIFTDVQLKTKTKSFQAHKIVLFARSPVFKEMLTSNLNEKNTDCIQVDDLQDDVVRQLLLFLYADTVENLHWESATRLYCASDKYEVGPLKDICSSFLVGGLNPTNAGELLLLADTHGDGDLKQVVEDYILEHEEQVFGLDEWEKLMERNPVLLMKAVLLKYKRKEGSIK